MPAKAPSPVLPVALCTAQHQRTKSCAMQPQFSTGGDGDAELSTGGQPGTVLNKSLKLGMEAHINITNTQETDTELFQLEASLGYLVRPCFKAVSTQKSTNWLKLGTAPSA